MANTARDTLRDEFRFVAIALLLTFTVAAFVGLRAVRVDTTPLDNRLRMVESKISDMAFAYRCHECGTTLLTDWHIGDQRCSACQKPRQFAGITVFDPHTMRGYNDRPNKPGTYSVGSIPKKAPCLCEEIKGHVCYCLWREHGCQCKLGGGAE